MGEQERNPRYRWLGERPRSEALRRLTRSQLMVISSRMEGGANVIGEAATLGVPILASRVAGNVGLLGPWHPGLFQVADTGPARTAPACRGAGAFYQRFKRASKRIAPQFAPERERRVWRTLLGELIPS